MVNLTAASRVACMCDWDNLSLKVGDPLKPCSVYTKANGMYYSNTSLLAYILLHLTVTFNCHFKDRL